MKYYVLLALFLCHFSFSAYDEQQTIVHLKQAIAPIMPESVFEDLSKLVDQNDEPIIIEQTSSLPSLFKEFPSLAHTIAHVSLASLPTPITECPNVADQLGVAELLIKRDDLTGKKLHETEHLFGGNKVRKLEFLLGDALAKKVDTVMTFGCVGSNHALATAVYAKAMGLKSIIMLLPQANSLIVQRNLLLDFDADAIMIFSPTNRLRALSSVYQFLSHKLEFGTFPYVIPTGGSCPLGILGYVNAAFELKEQIDAGILKEPTKIYVPVGSCGTYVGLLLGLKAANIQSILIGISVEPDDQEAQMKKIKKLYKETNVLLHDADINFPLIPFIEHDIHVLRDFTGKGYALFTQEGVDAIHLLQDKAGIMLDGVYSGKAFAGLLSDVQNNASRNDIILFWNTFCADNFAHITSDINYKSLPNCLHPFFESKPLQEALF